MSKLEDFSRLFADKHIEQGTLQAEVRFSNYAWNSQEAFKPVSDLMIVFIILKGSLQINIDGQTQTCTNKTNNLIDIKPFNRIEALQIGKGMHAYVMAISRSFMDAAAHGNRPVLRAMHQFSSNFFSLKRTEIDILLTYFKLIQQNTHSGESALDKIIFQHTVLLFHAKVIKMTEAYLKTPLKPQEISRSTLLCNRFFALLETQATKEHEVSFYARKLSISTHYLTRICQRYTGKSANQTIADMLVTKASVFLRKPELSIQQVADQLGFSDASTFGKFFRRHTGKTPTEYRNENSIPLIIE